MTSQRLYDVRGRLHDPAADQIEVPCLTRAELRGASPWLLNVNGCPAVGPNQFQADAPSVYQGFPNTADLLLRWLGGGVYPAGWGVANVLAIYACDTATPLVDSLGLGPNLVAAGAPLTGRECIGLGQAGSFTSKVGVETTAAGDTFAAAAGAFMSLPDGVQKWALIVWRGELWTGARNILSWAGAVPLWQLFSPTNNVLRLTAFWGAGADLANVNVEHYDGAWHCALITFDANPAVRLGWIFSDLGDAGGGVVYGAQISGGASTFMIGRPALSQLVQVAYIACGDGLATSAMRANFWRHAQVPVPFLHARNSPQIAPISASRVACWGPGNVGQAAVSYSPALVTVPLGNPLGTGYVAEDGVTFEAVGSTDFFGTSLGQGGCTTASVDGPSGMRDGSRATMAGAFAPGCWIGHSVGFTIPIVGASNVSWRHDINYRRATVGTTARMALYFSGDGGGPETLATLTDNATPADWTRNGSAVTPVGAAHNLVYRLYGAAVNLDNCDFGEMTLIKNRATASLAWRRVGTVAAAATVINGYSVVNTLNYVYSPLRGQIRLTIGNFQGTAGATFLRYGVPGAAGSLLLDYNAGQLRLQMWDGAAALALTILAGPVNAGRHEYNIMWSSAVPIRFLPWCYAAVLEGTTLLGQWLVGWTAATGAVTPLWIGSNGGVNAARCLIELA